jgi:hypothetical protein
LHMRLTSGTAFIRFNGHNLHPSDFVRIDAWIERLDKWIKAGLGEIYFFMHEPDKALTSDVCGYMIERINKLNNVHVKPLQPVDSIKKDLF